MKCIDDDPLKSSLADEKWDQTIECVETSHSSRPMLWAREKKTYTFTYKIGRKTKSRIEEQNIASEFKY